MASFSVFRCVLKDRSELLDKICYVIHELELRDVEFAFLSRSVSYARSGNMMLVGMKSREEPSELLDGLCCMSFQLRKVDELEISMLSTGVLTEGCEAIGEVAMLNVFLQAHVPTINFFIAEKLSCPLHNVLPEKFVPLVQRIGGQKLAGVRELPIAPEGLENPVQAQLPCGSFITTDVRWFYFLPHAAYNFQRTNTSSGRHLHASAEVTMSAIRDWRGTSMAARNQ